MATLKSAAAGAPPLPGRVARLLRESRWLALAVLAAYLVLILATYHRGDPGWSHSVAAERIHNAGGQVGAYLADLLLYLFGVSAWWWVLLLVYAVIWGYRRLDGSSISDHRPFIVALAGFSVLLVGSTGLETLRFHTLRASLPLAPGGMLGAVVGEVARVTFGFTGATLILLAASMIGLSLFTGISWLSAMERVGAALEFAWGRALELWERRADRKAGRSPRSRASRRSRRTASASSSTTNRSASRRRCARSRSPSG